LYWAISLAWALSCLTAGYRVVQRAAPFMALRRQLVIALPIGVLVFALLQFFLGVLGFLGKSAFVLLPLALLSWGSATLYEAVARAWRLFQRRAALGGKRASPHNSTWVILLTGGGCIAIALLYAQILTPQAFSFDARWYHLPMAEKYALTGEIARFKEGFWMGAYPQLATYLYAWAFTMPASRYFDQAGLCAHMEFLLFLATLAQVNELARVLLPNIKRHLSWLALFLFPGIFLYDSNLNAGADHIAAFFSIPMVLLLWRAWHSFDSKSGILFVSALAGAVLTKYTVIMLVMPLGLMFAARGFWLCAFRRESKPLVALLWSAMFCAALTSIHWLKNWIWYGDPLFPLLSAHFNPRPWNEDAGFHIEYMRRMARSAELTWDNVIKAIGTVFTFSFIPNNWPVLHGKVPVFGPLFTLTLPLLLFLRHARRIRVLYLVVCVGIFIWYFPNRFDRYLQCLVPLMAAGVAAVLCSVWRMGPSARLALIPLVALQVLWGSNVPFVATHNLIQDSPLRLASQFIGDGFWGRPSRLIPYPEVSALTTGLPKDSVILCHDMFMLAGLRRSWVTDLHQTSITYGRLRTPAAIDAKLRELGVTHIAWTVEQLDRDSIAGSLAFLRYAEQHTNALTSRGNYTVARIPDQAMAEPQEKVTDLVAHFGCATPYDTGIYDLAQMIVPAVGGVEPPQKVRPLTVTSTVEDVAFVVIDTTCHSQVEAPSGFRLVGTRDKLQFYLREATVAQSN
jgi:hypothetical protein